MTILEERLAIGNIAFYAGVFFATLGSIILLGWGGFFLSLGLSLILVAIMI